MIEKSRCFIQEVEIEDLKNTDDVYYYSNNGSSRYNTTGKQSKGELEFYGEPGDHIGFRY